MTPRLKYLIIVCLFLSSCSVTRRTAIQNSKVDRIIIASTNLSEDISPLSTKEDELLLLVFSYIDNQPVERLVAGAFKFDKRIRSFSISIDPGIQKLLS